MMHCSCGNTVCMCQIVCRCCPRCRCRCLQCSELRRQRGSYCDHCGGFVNAVMFSPIHEWTRTGIYPNLDFISSNQLQQSRSESDGRTDMRRSISQASPNSRDSETDESLIFQMDDIDGLPEVPTSTSDHQTISFTRHSQVTPNITVLSTVQSQISDMSIRRNVPLLYSQISDNAYSQRHIESDNIEIPSLCNPNVLISESTESQPREIPILQYLPGCSQISPHSDVSRPRVYAIAPQSLCNPIASVSESTESHIREKPIPKDFPGCSRHKPNESVSKPGESQMTDCAWCMIPSPSNISASKRAESQIKEIPISQDISGSQNNPNEGISIPEEPQIVSELCMTSSSNEFLSDSLPSLPSTSSSDGSPLSIDSRSPTHRISTSAPAIYDIPEPASISESLDLETEIEPSTSETSPVSESETLRTSELADEARTMSESSSSIETLPSDMANIMGNINGHPDLPSICATSALNNISVHSSPLQAESVKLSEFQSSTANRLKLPSPEMSTADRRRKSSESSIETISRDPANETSEDENSADKSPGKEK